MLTLAFGKLIQFMSFSGLNPTLDDGTDNYLFYKSLKRKIKSRKNNHRKMYISQCWRGICFSQNVSQSY